MKICKKCGTLKELDQFNKHPKTKDGLQSWCKPCTLEDAINAKRMRTSKRSTVYKVETGGTTFGGNEFVVLDHKKVTGKYIDKFNDDKYIKKESSKLFNFLTDNLPVKVFKELTRIMIDYDARMELINLDMNKFNLPNQDLINLQKELK